MNLPRFVHSHSHRYVASAFIVWLCISHVAVHHKMWCGRTIAIMHMFLICQHYYQSVCVTELYESIVYLSYLSSRAGVEYLSNDCTVYSDLVRINPTIWCTFPPVSTDIILLQFLIFKIWRFYKLLLFLLQL